MNTVTFKNGAVAKVVEKTAKYKDTPQNRKLGRVGDQYTQKMYRIVSAPTQKGTGARRKRGGKVVTLPDGRQFGIMDEKYVKVGKGWDLEQVYKDASRLGVRGYMPPAGSGLDFHQAMKNIQDPKFMAQIKNLHVNG